MLSSSENIEKLISELESLPGVGRKSAGRLLLLMHQRKK